MEFPLVQKHAAFGGRRCHPLWQSSGGFDQQELSVAIMHPVWVLISSNPAFSLVHHLSTERKGHATGCWAIPGHKAGETTGKLK